jgi:hypothetical protein
MWKSGVLLHPENRQFFVILVFVEKKIWVSGIKYLS